MEEAKEAIKNFFKKIKVKYSKRIIRVSIVVVLLIVLLAGSLYFVTVDDGTYKEDDWSSTPYAAGEYINGISVNSDGTLKNATSAQELWDKMLENGSRVDEYLDSPEELARLMKAEIVTQYPDTRENPDEEINWEDIVENSDTLQGIIKFKRADSNGNKSTMSYVDPETFQGYIDEYNNSGSETAKKNALSHFTLKKTTASTSTENSGLVAAGEGVMTDVSQAIIKSANDTPWPGSQLCAKWVNDVYTNAGLPVKRTGSAYSDYKQRGVISTDKSAIPVGATVYGTGHQSNGCGHVGIYLGGGKVIDSVSSGKKVHNSLEDWISWQTDVIEGQQGWLGWGWADGNTIRGTTQDSYVIQDSSNSGKNMTNEEDKKDKEQQIQKAVETEVNGDGYSQEYTSSAGITYKHYKQIEGSYANNSYWDGTIRSSGCGPTSVAILASGLTNLNYTPGDIATQMNSVYGYTGSTPLKGEMDSLGMPSEIIENPSAAIIQENLRNGKVMLISVNSNTIFTDISHIMAVVDINSEGQVYICNPSSRTLYGWYDVNELMKGCNYIVVTDAGAAGIASSINTSSYNAVVATWRQVDTTITSDDPNVEQGSRPSQYAMTTTNVNYEEMVSPYTMPFDLLWALLVVGEDKNFVFEIANLVYGSDIQITIYDNLTVNTDVDEWNYTQRTKAIVDATITAICDGKKATGRINNDIHDPHNPDNEKSYTTTKTVVTKTNTVNVALTRANVWIVDYQNDYTYVSPTETEPITNSVSKEDEVYPESPTSIDNSYSCEHINAKKQELEKRVIELAVQDVSSDSMGMGSFSYIVIFDEEINVKYYTKYVNIVDNITNKVSTQKYVQGIPSLEEKTDKDSDEDNFVTIFNKYEYKKNKSNIKSASSWLFEIIETNDSTKNMLDLVKYLLYKATDVSYGVKEFDFSIFYPGGLTTVGEGDYIVHIDKSSSDIVITDVETLKKAFAGYSGSSQLINHAQEFLDLQEQYRVNAVFAAAVSISETSAGRAGHAVDGKNNWFNIECTCGGNHGRFETYSSVKQSIEAFYKQISVKNYYFTSGKFTVSEIGMVYCENADAPGGWIENTTTFMAQMFQAAGINPSSSGTNEKGKTIVENAKTKQGCAYQWGHSGPNTFDCSGFTMWCYKQVGIDIPHNSEQQKNAAKKVLSVSEARVGDILWKNGHVGIYIGNNQYIHAPQTGDVVKIANGASGYFTYALQFY